MHRPGRQRVHDDPAAALRGARGNSLLQRSDVQPLALAPGIQPQFRQLHALGSFAQVPAKSVAADHVAQKEFPLDLKGILIAAFRIRHFLPAFEKVDRLLDSLILLCDGPLGGMFNRQTTERLRLDAPAVCIDVSSLSKSDKQMQAAALLAAWNEGFGAINATNMLADAGLMQQRWYFAVLDELWRPLSLGEGLVDHVNRMTRLNREDATAMLSITHSVADMEAIDSHADRKNAQGFIGRAGGVLIGGVPPQELDALEGVLHFTDEERARIIEWGTPSAWSADNGSHALRTPPPGQGKFMYKVGERPGIPFHLQLVDGELGLHDTNYRWLLDRGTASDTLQVARS